VVQGGISIGGRVLEGNGNSAGAGGCCAAHGAARRLQKTHLCSKVLLVLSAVYRARVNTSDILLGRVGLFSPLLI
jgi:hypothetical protein